MPGFHIRLGKGERSDLLVRQMVRGWLLMQYGAITAICQYSWYTTSGATVRDLFYDDAWHFEDLVTQLPLINTKNFVKLNVDGNSLGLALAARLGTLVENGCVVSRVFCVVWIPSWRLSYKGYPPRCSSGLERRLSFYNLRCDSDSKMALDMVQQGVSSFHPVLLWLTAIATFQVSANAWEVSFVHTLREGPIGWLCRDLLRMQLSQFGMPFPHTCLILC